MSLWGPNLFTSPEVVKYELCPELAHFLQDLLGLVSDCYVGISVGRREKSERGPLSSVSAWPPFSWDKKFPETRNGQC